MILFFFFKRILSLTRFLSLLKNAVPQKYHSQFITKRLVNKIADENNGVIIQFPKESSGSDLVTIKGAKEFVESAKLRILEKVDDLQQQITHEIEIDSKYHGSVIGTRAHNLVQIEQKHDVRIVFPKRAEQRDDDQPKQKRSNKVQIQGKKENCEKAAQDLFALVPKQIEFQVPFEFHKNIIGKGM